MNPKQLMWLLLVMAACVAPTPAQTAPTLGAIYSFTNQGGDGAFPQYGKLAVGPKGTLYGMTNTGGSLNWGIVYELQPPSTAGGSWTETVLHTFDGTYGGSPLGGLLLARNGKLYGATTQGGPNPTSGVVFELTPPSEGGTWTYKVIYDFGGAPDASGPDTSLVEGPNGELYGTTFYGGTSKLCFTGCGAVFELTPPASAGGSWTESVVHSFPGGDGGAYPNEVILAPNGDLYGTTKDGGAQQGQGIVYQLSPPATSGGPWTYTVVYTFICCLSDGSGPGGPLLIWNGALYGTTGGGGPYNHGTVFQLIPPATPGGTWSETVLYSFAQAESHPQGGLAAGPNGELYGATNNIPGSVFKLVPPATTGGSWTKVLLADLNGTDGSQPWSGVTIGRGGNLYGTASYGGLPNCSPGCGTVFQVIP